MNDSSSKADLQFLFSHISSKQFKIRLTLLILSFFSLGAAQPRGEEGPRTVPQPRKEPRRRPPVIDLHEDQDSDDLVEEGGAQRGRTEEKGRHAARAEVIWSTLEKMWDFDDRPEELQHKENVALLTLEDIKMLKELHTMNKEKTTGRKDTLVRDKRPKDVNFHAGKDNCFDHLHQARWLRQNAGEKSRSFSEHGPRVHRHPESGSRYYNCRNAR